MDYFKSFIVFLLCVFLYLVGLSVYRLYFHPLAKFPGPRIAALTKWTEAYYEICYGDGGQYSQVYAEWHKRYGPIIRISPDELHVHDSSFFEVLYSSGRPLNKLKSLEHRFGNPLSAFATADHTLHRHRRSALNPYFSRRRITQHSPAIQKLLDRVSERLQNEFMGNSRVLNLNAMWGCWSSDIIVDYCFENSHNFIEEPNFRSSYTSALIDLLEPVHVITHFPIIPQIFSSLPESWVGALNPQMASVLQFNQELKSEVEQVLSSRKLSGTKDEKKRATVFNALLDSDLPPEELSVHRLQHEAISLTGAAVETTMRTLSVICFHLLSQPSMLQKLQDELDKKMPNPTVIAPYDELSQLPYLTACIEEGLRLSYGAAQRLPRVIKDAALPYGDFVIPINATVSMDIPAVAHDEAIFPDSNTYQPDRWLGNPVAPDGKKLSRYMVSFGRGTRSCTGMQLAYAELYVGIATILRRFNLELFETDRSAVDLHMDRVAAKPKPGTLGVQVLVKSLRT